MYSLFMNLGDDVIVPSTLSFPVLEIALTPYKRRNYDVITQTYSNGVGGVSEQIDRNSFLYKRLRYFPIANKITRMSIKIHK